VVVVVLVDENRDVDSEGGARMGSVKKDDSWADSEKLS
jgi:hypothetical protein